MFNESKTALWFVLLAAVLMVADTLSVSAETPPGMTYRNYPEWYILPKDLDFEDENVIVAFQQLDEGEAAHPAMLAIVKECEDPLACHACPVGIAEIERRQAQGHCGAETVFAERLPCAKDDEEWLMTALARFFADFGTEEDAVALLPMLSHSNWRVRTLGARYLGQRGDRRVIEALEAAQSCDSDSTVVEEIGKAISAIESRQAGQNSETEASAVTTP